MPHSNSPTRKCLTLSPLRDPEPDPLEDVPWGLHRPVRVSRIKRGLAGLQICFRGSDPLGALEDFPEEVKAEEDGDSDVGGDELVNVERGAPDVETIEDDDYDEVYESSPGGVWLPGRFEY